MSPCTDPKTGQLIHNYELNMLSGDELERFEIHMLECGYCFGETERFKEFGALLRTDPDVKQVVEGVLAKHSKASLWARLKQYLWPDTNLALKPAFMYLLIMLLIYPAYRGIIGLQGEKIQTTKILTFIPSRSAGLSTSSKGHDISINFVFLGAKPGKAYIVSILDSNRKSIYIDKNYRDFDQSGMGGLHLPQNALKPGLYSILIEDPIGIQPNDRQEYSIRIEK
jgi:hypothetical protein